MNVRRLSVWGSFLCLLGLAAVGADWETDFEKAKGQAERQGRFILVDFSGSDWCGWCKKLDREVFSQNEFKKYAKENLVLMLADFPRGKKLPKKDAAQNEALRQEYGVRGYPTVVLMLPSGEEVARTGYQEGGAEKYVAHLEELLAAHKDRLPQPAEDRGGSKSRRPSSSLGKSSKGPEKDKTPAQERGAADDQKRKDAVDKAL